MRESAAVIDLEDYRRRRGRGTPAAMSSAPPVFRPPIFGFWVPLWIWA